MIAKDILDNTATGLAGSVTGEIGNELGYAIGNLTGSNAKKANDQVNQQRRLTEIQEASNSRLMEESFSHQKNPWDETNAEAQIAHYKAAGLNPALMYAKGGAGGSTGSGGASVGGSSASGEAERQQAQNQTTGMGLQMMKMQSEIELNKATADKLKSEVPVNQANVPKIQAETGKIGNEIENIKADTALKGEETKLNQLQQNTTKIANSYNSENNLTMLWQNIEILRELGAKANIAIGTQNSIIEQAKENVKLTITQELLNTKKTAEAQQSILASINEQVLNRITVEANKNSQELRAIQENATMLMNQMTEMNKLSQDEAKTIINILGTMLGASILKGVITGHNPEQEYKDWKKRNP